jgi:hypothetical protein
MKAAPNFRADWRNGPMAANWHKPFRGHAVRFLISSIVCAIIMASVGMGVAYAETKNSLYITSAGNYGTAQTTGYYDGNAYHATGYSHSSWSSSTYYIGSDIRIWHNGSKQEVSNVVSCNYCSTAQTIAAVYVVNDPAATMSTFQAYSFSNANSYFTSYLDNTGSCYTYWNSGGSC